MANVITVNHLRKTYGSIVAVDDISTVTVPIYRLIEQWGLVEKRNAYFGKLSGGQQQRLFIALALINDPDIVFFDELTTGLDPQARRATWDLVQGVRAQGKTVVLVTHAMDEAELLADRVAIIDHGRIVALDTPQALIQRVRPGTLVRFTTSNGFDPALLTQVDGVHAVERDGAQVTVRGAGPLLSRVAQALADHHVEPADLRQERATVAQALGMALLMPMLFLSGAAMPRETMPENIQRIGDFLPLTYVVELLKGLWFGQGWNLPAVAVLLGMLAVGTLLATRTFRWE